MIKHAPGDLFPEELLKYRTSFFESVSDLEVALWDYIQEEWQRDPDTYQHWLERYQEWQAELDKDN